MQSENYSTFRAALILINFLLESYLHLYLTITQTTNSTIITPKHHSFITVAYQIATAKSDNS